MKIVVDINHPGHVHFFKNFIWEMEKRGHKILITVKEKDVTLKLLDSKMPVITLSSIVLPKIVVFEDNALIPY